MKRRSIILVILLVLLTGCEEYATYTPSAADLTTIAEQMPDGPTKQAVQSTAVARYLAAQAASGTADAAQAQANAALAQAQAARDEFQRQTAMMTAEAQSTSDALAASARFTSQALDALATTQAGALAATATAEAHSATSTAESRNATATTESRNATATATAYVATATRQAQREAITQTVEAAEAVFAAATVTAVHQQTEIDADRQMLTTFGGWGLLAVGYATLGWILWQLFPILKVKIGQIHRDERGDLPAMATATSGGAVIIYDPARGFGPATIIDQAIKRITQPLLTPTAAAQEGTTKRSQFVDLVKGGRPNPIIPFSHSLPTPNNLPAQAGENGASQWEDVTPTAPAWPTSVNLLDVFASRSPSINSIVVGLNIDQNGQQHIITASLYELMHVLTVGSSGWGKSTWLRSFLWQLARAPEHVQVAAIDVFGSEFNLLTGWSKLLYPVARDIEHAKAILYSVSQELEWRKKIFEHVPLASNLPQFNSLTGENIPPIVLLADEGAALLNRPDTKDFLRDAIQTARQYGIYCVLATVTATHKTIPTTVRDQFSTRLCFRTSPTSSQVVLDDRCAGSINIQGRAYAQLIGRNLIEIQGLQVARQHLLQALTPAERPALEPESPEQEEGEKEQQIIDLLQSTDDEGNPLSDSAIAQAVFGYQNVRVRDLVREIRTRMDGRTERTDGQSGRTD